MVPFFKAWRNYKLQSLSDVSLKCIELDYKSVELILSTLSDKRSIPSVFMSFNFLNGTFLTFHIQQRSFLKLCITIYGNLINYFVFILSGSKTLKDLINKLKLIYICSCWFFSSALFTKTSVYMRALY